MAKEPKSGLRVDEDLIRKLAGLLDETGLGEIEIEEGDSKIKVSRGGTLRRLISRILHAGPEGDDDFGTARVTMQGGDDSEVIEEAIDVCPADCIHTCSRNELEVLEIFGDEGDVRLCCQLKLAKETDLVVLEVRELVVVAGLLLRGAYRLASVPSTALLRQLKRIASRKRRSNRLRR